VQILKVEANNEAMKKTSDCFNVCLFPPHIIKFIIGKKNAVQIKTGKKTWVGETRTNW